MVNVAYNNVIPMNWLHWAWQTWFDEDFFEVELKVGETFQTLQGFNYQFTPFCFPVFKTEDIGKSKVFLVSSRYCEVNGNEFYPADIESYKIVIGEIVEIDTFEAVNPYPTKTWVTETWLQYTPLTPAYKILVKHIFPLKSYLRDFLTKDLLVLVDFFMASQTDFNFYQLRYDRQSCGIYNDCPYRLEPNMIAHDLIHIFVRTDECNAIDYLIVKQKTKTVLKFSISYYEQYILDDEFYLLANHQLSEDEIKLLTLDNDICKKFFEI